MTITEKWVSVPDACKFEVGDRYMGGVVIGVDRERNRLLVRLAGR